jgi:trans-aconitate 2-methyltransferase
MAWDPALYERFKGEREQPFHDLLALLSPGPLGRVIDLGCGTGELTAQLAERLAVHDVLGVDSSEEMLARSAKVVERWNQRRDAGTAGHLTGAWPRLHFRRQTIEEVLVTTPPREYDLVFSHAALHWVEDHARLFPRLLLLLRPGGQLLVQMPSNHTHPAWAIAARVAGTEPFRTALGGQPPRASPVLEIPAYAQILYAAGAARMAVLERVYPHVLEDAAAVAKWMRGTTLVPLLERLPEDLREPFIAAFAALLGERFPERPLFYPFKRTLLQATAPG